MFMFRSRRNALVKRAWKARRSATAHNNNVNNNVNNNNNNNYTTSSSSKHFGAVGGGGGRGGFEGLGCNSAYDGHRLDPGSLALPSAFPPHPPDPEEDLQSCDEDDLRSEVKSAALGLLKKLSETQLVLFVASVESGGAEPGQCVLVPRGDVRVGRRQVPPHLLFVWVWRWPDLARACTSSSSSSSCPALRRLPWCAARNENVYVCVNPHHWARLLQPESPPPPYTRFSSDLLKPEDTAPSEEGTLSHRPLVVESQETGGTNQNGSYSYHPGVSPWCQVAYWEERNRVGRLYPVRTPTLNILGDTPHGDGLSLATLATQAQTPPTDPIKRTRDKIGLGLVLSQEVDGVWVYNRSDVPLFIHSPTLDVAPHSRFTVHKLLPGYTLNIFDYEKAQKFKKLPPDPDLLHEGPIDTNSVRISFAKGWGPKYSRQFITSCPCWLEILLFPAR
ncbi:daughters against dpp [Oratosquilla oratoria]|uniref:daughters against dpp n=1 Tax=Oratosquilla oratoria TaxID=337810 RepID=UPI003F758CFD